MVLFFILLPGLIAILNGRQNAAAFYNTLRDILLPFEALMHGENWVYQQDISPLHTAQLTKEWFETNYVDVMKWPSRSPDLNTIENVWAHIDRKVYANGRQFMAVDDLKNSIEEEWEKIPDELFQNLACSIRMRCVAELRSQGAKILYERTFHDE